MYKGTIETFLRYRHLLINLISRDLKVKYRRSVFGILWSLMNPIFTMLILNAVFSTIFRFEIENFPLYLISGQILFAFFTEATSSSLFSVVGASSLMKKVYVPKYIFPLEKSLYAGVNLMFSLIALVVMMVIYRVPLSWTMLLFPIPLVTMFVFATGLGLILATMCVFFRDIQYLYTVLTTAWMYLTPIIYPIETIASRPFIYNVVSINPLTAYISYFRDVVLYGALPTLQQNLLCFGYAIFFIIFGLWLFKKLQDKFILHI